MRFRGLVQPPCDGVLPLLPLRWGLCPASVRRAVQPLGEPPTPSGDGSRFRAPVAPQRADGAVPAPSQPDTIPSFFHLASLSYLSIGSVLTLVQSTLSTGVDKYSRASAHQRACVRAGGGAPYVCVTQPLTVAERKRRKENRTEKTGLFVFLNVENKKPPRQPRRDKSWGFSLVGLGQWVRAKRLRSALHQERNHIHHIDSKRSQ